jgi:hypothetical protein
VVEVTYDRDGGIVQQYWLCQFHASDALPQAWLPTRYTLQPADVETEQRLAAMDQAGLYPDLVGMDPPSIAQQGQLFGDIGTKDHKTPRPESPADQSDLFSE